MVISPRLRPLLQTLRFPQLRVPRGLKHTDLKVSILKALLHASAGPRAHASFNQHQSVRFGDSLLTERQIVRQTFDTAKAGF